MAQFARVPAIEWKGGDGSQSGTRSSWLCALKRKRKGRPRSAPSAKDARLKKRHARTRQTPPARKPMDRVGFITLGWTGFTMDTTRMSRVHRAPDTCAPLALCLPRTPKGCALSPSTTTDGLLMGSVKWFINYPPSRMKAQAKATLAIVSKGEEFVNLLDISLLWLVVDPIYTYIDAGCLF
jgi:hypothetical protein